jgi:hypothetical protein
MFKFASFQIVGFDFRVTKIRDNYESCTMFCFFHQDGNVPEDQLRCMVVGLLPIYKTKLLFPILLVPIDC